jgi:hypothetical protein
LLPLLDKEWLDKPPLASGILLLTLLVDTLILLCLSLQLQFLFLVSRLDKQQVLLQAQQDFQAIAISMINISALDNRDSILATSALELKFYQPPQLDFQAITIFTNSISVLDNRDSRLATSA